MSQQTKAITMSFCPQAFMLVFLMMYQMPKCATVLGGSCCAIPPIQKHEKAFQQKADKFYVFEEQSNSWKEVQLPFDLYNCLNDNCTKFGSIEQRREGGASSKKKDETSKSDEGPHTEENIDPVLPLRRRTSITKMSDSSVWVTGESGSIYERFWNGLQWVITPHDLPISAHAISVFIVNQTILALDDDGVLHKATRFVSPLAKFVPSICLLQAKAQIQDQAYEYPKMWEPLIFMLSERKTEFFRNFLQKFTCLLPWFL